MKLSLQSSEIHVDSSQELDYFVQNTGEKYWRKQCKEFFEHRNSSNPYTFQNLIKEFHPFTHILFEYFALIDSNHRQKINNSVELRSLVVSIYFFNFLHRHLMASGMEKEAKQICSDLKENAYSFLFEVQVLANLVSAKFEVELTDLCRQDKHSRSFDYLISKDGFEGEVECKRIDYSTGKKINPKVANTLCLYMFEISLKPIKNRLYIKLVFDDRLEKCDEQKLRKYIKKVEEIIESGAYETEIKFQDLTISVNQIEENFVISPGEEKELEKRDLILNKYSHKDAINVIFSTNKNLFLISVESKKSASLLTCISKTLKEAASGKKAKRSQLTGHKPAMLLCYIDGIESNEWLEFSQHIAENPAAIDVMSNDFFEINKDVKDRKRRHVNVLAYTSAPVHYMNERYGQPRFVYYGFVNQRPLFPEANPYFLQAIPIGQD